ncbi:hypothetical protein [Streptomyces sp. NPDC097610]|uniref:hypothetical protein n=1 Tax=Streptomyces sp. NPDC097610 TaxID=3157227 RepID=UPI003331B161
MPLAVSLDDADLEGGGRLADGGHGGRLGGWAAATVVVIPASRAAETAATDFSFRRTSREGAGRKGLPFVAGSGR